MPLPLPNLDDRTFRQLLDEARRKIALAAPDWTDLSPGDPGTVLLETFAYLTETMIYRLNRLPRKAYIAYLRLLGVVLQPPAAATVNLRFSRTDAAGKPIQIPRGTRVTLKRADAGQELPVFITARTATLAPDAANLDVLAYHAEAVEAEQAGTGTGLAGYALRLKRPPVIAPTGDELDLVVGVEAQADELDERLPARQFDGRRYRIWREVESFSAIGPDPYVYIADRLSGIITFAPAAFTRTEDGTLSERQQFLGAVPAAGRDIRVWYRRGGGSAGNVAAGTLTVLRDPIAGLQVTNPDAATGGRNAETLENALIRGPQELHSLQRAVTASDFELVAQKRSPSVARARAMTRADIWSFATAGTVEVILVPYLPEKERLPGQVTAAALHQHETPDARMQIQSALDERRPLGTTVLVNWARYKTVRVKARVVVRREEDLAAVRQRVINRVYQSICPLPTEFNSTGWQFGEALRASKVYDIALAEPGVRWVDGVRLQVDEVPSADVRSITADAFESHTWYAASGARLFRSRNDGDGWELVARFDGEELADVRSHPARPGLLAVSSLIPGSRSARIHLSVDCGENWLSNTQNLAFVVNDMAWIQRDVPVLLLATDAGLFEMALRGSATPVQVLVDPQKQTLGFNAVAVATDVRGVQTVAVAGMMRAGVYLSTSGGAAGSFRRIGTLTDDQADIATMSMQYIGPQTFLWIGTAAQHPEDPGKGCLRWELRGTQDPPEGWVAFGQGWNGGSCRAIGFQGSTVYASSHHQGILSVDTMHGIAPWKAPAVNCGLPRRDEQFLFQPVNTLSVDPLAHFILAGGGQGVYRSDDAGKTYQPESNAEFIDKVTLPETWLFVSGEHEITVASEDEAS